jgi:mannose-6-phosphate isomerase-like protein (cupin superfamily)
VEKIVLSEKFAQFNDHWHPRIIGELNGQYVKIAKIRDEFVWHSHAHEDELFMVIQGKLIMDFRDKTVEVVPGELLIVPKSVEHRPRTEGETQIMMIEPKSTVNTGELVNECTRTDLEVV